MAGSSWPALVAGAKARASDVEAKLDWIEGNIVPMNGGSQTTGAYDLGTSAAKWRSGYISTRVNAPAFGLSDTTFLSFDATGTITANKPMKMTNGVAIDEFSSDTLLAGNSDLAVPTEKAVKTYVDANVVVRGSSTHTSLGINVIGTIGNTLTALSISSSGEFWIFHGYAQFVSTSTSVKMTARLEINKDGETVTGTDIIPGAFGILVEGTHIAEVTQAGISIFGGLSLTSGGHTFYLMWNGTNANAPSTSSLLATKR